MQKTFRFHAKSNLTNFAISTSMDLVVAGGENVAICLSRVDNGEILYFKLPQGFIRVEKLQFLRKPGYLAMLSEGQFFLIELATMKIQMHIRMPSKVLFLSSSIDYQVFQYRYKRPKSFIYFKRRKPRNIRYSTLPSHMQKVGYPCNI